MVRRLVAALTEEDRSIGSIDWQYADAGIRSPRPNAMSLFGATHGMAMLLSSASPPAPSSATNLWTDSLLGPYAH